MQMKLPSISIDNGSSEYIVFILKFNLTQYFSRSQDRCINCLEVEMRKSLNQKIMKACNGLRSFV